MMELREVGLKEGMDIVEAIEAGADFDDLKMMIDGHGDRFTGLLASAVFELVDLRRKQKSTPSLNDIAQAVNKLAWDKGFHSNEEGDDQYVERACNNLHDEVSEFHEAWRNNKLHEPCDKPGLELTCLEEELADIVIRALDGAVKLGVDIGRAVMLKHGYNEGRSHRHGNKRS